MADGLSRGHLVCYDIADPRRLSKVHRVLVKHGVPVQYSVFMVVATREVLDELLALLRGLINESEDDLRVYPLPTRPDVTRLGRGCFPEGVCLLDQAQTGSMLWS